MRSILKERIAEFRVTDWSGVRITISIDHPDAPHSLSYRLYEDARLLPFSKIRKPPTDNQVDWFKFQKELDMRSERVRLLADKIAHAVMHAMERVDES